MTVGKSETSVVLVCDTTWASKRFAISHDESVTMGIVGGIQNAAVLRHVMANALSVCEALGHFPASPSGGRFGSNGPIEEDMGLLHEDTCFVDGCIGSRNNGDIGELFPEGLHQVCERRWGVNTVSDGRILGLIGILLDKDRRFSSFGGRDHIFLCDQFNGVAEVFGLPDFMQSTEFFGGNGTIRHFGRRLCWLELTNPF
jgi:hypothetical protein